MTDLLTCTTLDAVLEYLKLGLFFAPDERRLRLFGCACVRSVWNLLCPESRAAVEATERYADGGELASAHERARSVRSREQKYHDPVWLAAEAVADLSAPDLMQGKRNWVAKAPRLALEAYRLSAGWRLPWYEAGPKRERAKQEGERLFIGFARDIFGTGAIDCLTPTVQRLAQAAYEDRLPSGELDRGILAVLADAVEEAGCSDEALLGHLRGPGSCVRGCFAVDLLAGMR